MVFRGKPSKACLQCRKRKLRCDLKRHSCSQCIRAGLTCSGYRDTEQLQVRDESQRTRQKVLARFASISPIPLSVPLDERARNAFFSHYVSGFTKTYDVLGPLYGRNDLESHLAASVDAVSLAFFSFHFSHEPASRIATEKYSTALPLLNAALRSVPSATTDSTLLAVLLLDLFEKIINNDPRSRVSWMSHVNGALALVKLRDAHQFENYTGLRLSSRLSTNLLISCVAADAPVPSELVKLRSDLEDFLNKDDPKWRVSGLIVKFTRIRALMQDECGLSPALITRAAELDQEFIALTKDMPPSWLYQRTYLDHNSERVFDKYFDIYHDHQITQTWNVLRLMRILVNDLIQAQYAKDTSISPPSDPISCIQNDVAIVTIDSLTQDICASAPQYVGLERRSYSEKQRLECYTLLLPLYAAGKYASEASMIKPWVIKQLRIIHMEAGIRNANAVADLLDRADNTSVWSVYTMLGSYAFAA